jgi:hypothetical protein
MTEAFTITATTDTKRHPMLPSTSMTTKERRLATNVKKYKYDYRY